MHKLSCITKALIIRRDPKNSFSRPLEKRLCVVEVFGTEQTYECKKAVDELRKEAQRKLGITKKKAAASIKSKTVEILVLEGYFCGRWGYRPCIVVPSTMTDKLNLKSIREATEKERKKYKIPKY